MIGWTMVLIALWVIYLFFGGKAETEGENWRTSLIFSVITVCITLIMVWGDFK